MKIASCLSVISLFWVCWWGSFYMYAQELQCMVSVQAPTIQGIDPTILQQFQRDVMQYMNQRRWTNDQFEEREKIKCSITIIITALPSNDRFEGTAQVTATRPVYNSTYETQVFNFMDKQFRCNYVPFQNFEFSENTFVNNLVSQLNFYAYMILGFDYASFSNRGGIPIFQKAQNMVNLAQNANEAGWRAMDDPHRSRYWLAENVLNNSYSTIHDIIYRYHREGLDKMESDVNAGRAVILETLVELQKLFNNNPNIFVIRAFLDAKNIELAQLFKKAFPEEKQKFLRIMEQLDPDKMSQYEAINRE